MGLKYISFSNGCAAPQFSISTCLSIEFTLMLVTISFLVLIGHTLITMNTSDYIISCFTSFKLYIYDILWFLHYIFLFVKMITKLTKIQQLMLNSQSQDDMFLLFVSFWYLPTASRTLPEGYFFWWCWLLRNNIYIHIYLTFIGSYLSNSRQ